MTTNSGALRTLDTALHALARENCNEDEELIASFVTALHAWLKKSSHLKARALDQLHVAFLRRCQYSLEDTKRRIDAFYALRDVFPEVLRGRVVNDALLDVYKQGIHVIPSKPLATNGPLLIISQYSKYDPKKTNPREIFKLLFMLLELLALTDDRVTVSGIVYVIDARDVNMEQMMQFEPFLLKKTWMYIEHCIPWKFVEIHLINMRREGQAIFNFVTSFLPAKMPMKFIVHKKAEDLYEHIPRDAMTIEYGGHNGYQAEALAEWSQKLCEYKNYFAEDVNYGTNEKLRVGLCNNWETGELSGLSGSFRKLQVD